MATYKAEFLSHYYERRLRPRSAYAFGFIDVWARLASPAPWLANFVTQVWPLSAMAKLLAGVDQRRTIPKFASQTFQSWFRGHTHEHPSGQRVVLFPDTFTNNFDTSAARAAVTVLEDAGYRVEVPQFNVCCGRPLYDYGFLSAARRYWDRLLERMSPYIRDDLPMVVLEPSCWGAFKDELHSMMPGRVEAQRLAERTFTLSDFLKEEAHYTPPPLYAPAYLHGHCHEKSLEAMHDLEHGRLASAKHLLGKMHVAADTPESGCCGMAGGFGYEAGEHYEVSQKCGELALLPAVRESERMVIADGFSCRSQVEQGTGRRALHIPKVIEWAIVRRDAHTNGGETS